MTGEAVMSRAEMKARAAELAGELGIEVRLDEPLAPLVSMRVGGPAAALLLPSSRETLASAVRRLQEQGVPHVLLGGGSNLLVADTPLDAVVVHVASAAAGEGLRWDGDVVRAPAGMALGQVVSDAARRGMSGLEWAAGLPGSVGGAVFGNAGAFQGEIGRSVAEVVLLGLDGRLRTHVPAPDDFRYRGSFVAPGELVLEVALRLVPSTPDAVRAETNRVNRQRAGSQPKGGHSFGCMFKNPPGDSAGRLVDQCGLKGARVGGAFVSPTHGNFVINDGTATAADVAALVRRVRDEVKRRRGVELELEVQVWPSPGLVDDAPEGGDA